MNSDPTKPSTIVAHDPGTKEVRLVTSPGFTMTQRGKHRFDPEAVIPVKVFPPDCGLVFGQDPSPTEEVIGEFTIDCPKIEKVLALVNPRGSVMARRLYNQDLLILMRSVDGQLKRGSSSTTWSVLRSKFGPSGIEFNVRFYKNRQSTRRRYTVYVDVRDTEAHWNEKGDRVNHLVKNAILKACFVSAYRCKIKKPAHQLRR